MRKALLTLLVRNSYERADQPVYKLSSGLVSDTYINCKVTTMHAAAGPMIGQLCADLVPPRAQAVGGMTMGADAIASAISAYFVYVKGRQLHSFVVRKTPKEHGLKLYVEGVPCQRVVVVDDVVTTGGSTIQAIARCREAGLEVLAVIVLIDREESNGLQAVQAAAGAGVPVHAIFRKSELQEAYLSLRARRSHRASAAPSALAG